MFSSSTISASTFLEVPAPTGIQPFPPIKSKIQALVSWGSTLHVSSQCPRRPQWYLLDRYLWPCVDTSHVESGLVCVTSEVQWK